MHLDSKRIGKRRQKPNTIDHIRELLQLSPADSLLLDACARKTADDVNAILSTSCINPDLIRDKYLRTPLHIACSRQDDPVEATAIAKVLIQYGADVNNGVGDVDGFQPMHLAVLTGNFHCVLLLLEEGATVPASDPFRLTPLLLAKLKLDNLRQAPSPSSIVLTDNHSNAIEYDRLVSDNNRMQDMSDSAKAEYEGLISITKVLIKHLANKHMTTIGISLKSLSPSISFTSSNGSSTITTWSPSSSASSSSSSSSPSSSASSASASSSSSTSSSTLSSTSSSPSSSSSSVHYHGLSNSLFSNEQLDNNKEQLSKTIASLTEQLSTLEMKDPANSTHIRENLNSLIDKIRQLGIEE